MKKMQKGVDKSIENYLMQLCNIDIDDDLTDIISILDGIFKIDIQIFLWENFAEIYIGTKNNFQHTYTQNGAFVIQEKLNNIPSHSKQ